MVNNVPREASQLTLPILPSQIMSRATTVYGPFTSNKLPNPLPLIYQATLSIQEQDFNIKFM